MPRRLVAEDLLNLTFVADPQLSHDGRLGAAVTTRIVPGEGDEPPRYRPRVMVLDLDHGEERTFTTGAFADTAPSFGPGRDRLAFLRKASEKGKPQLALMPLDGGEAEVVTDFEAGVMEHCWHPDGRRIALTTRGSWTDQAAERGLPRRLSRLHCGKCARNPVWRACSSAGVRFTGRRHPTGAARWRATTWRNRRRVRCVWR